MLEASKDEDALKSSSSSLADEMNLVDKDKRYQEKEMVNIENRIQKYNRYSNICRYGYAKSLTSEMKENSACLTIRR